MEGVYELHKYLLLLFTQLYIHKIRFKMSTNLIDKVLIRMIGET